ncbi:MAG: hypothetical protein IKB32_00970 [Clostridia bacterium]|nr:hypothetical protein [Clostridia bacterium]
MKKKYLIIIAVVLLILFLIVVSINCLLTKLFENPVIASLPRYENSDCYYSDGFQDYTNYCKYYFSNNDTIIEILKENKYFKPLTQEDVEEVKSYFENFKGWVEYEEYEDKYDFRYDSVDTSDYFYIENKDNCEKYKIYPDKYAAYNVYFFDVQTKMLYFIHSNI